MTPEDKETPSRIRPAKQKECGRGHVIGGQPSVLAKKFNLPPNWVVEMPEPGTVIGIVGSLQPPGRRIVGLL